MNINSVQNVSALSSIQNFQQTENQPSRFESALKSRLSRVEDAVNSGQIDTAKMQEKLQSRFGDSVNAAFGDDGSVDFEKLSGIVRDQIGSMRGGMVPGGIGMSMGGFSAMSFQSSGISVDSSSLQTKLMDMFGEEAEGVVSEDGEVDMERLRNLAMDKFSSGISNSQSNFANQSGFPVVSQPIFIDEEA